MTENQWLSCEDPKQLANYLKRSGLLTTDKQERFIQASRQKYCKQYLKDPINPQVNFRNYIDEISADYEWPFTPWDKNYACHLFHEIWGNPFRPVRLSRNGRRLEEVKADRACPIGCCNAYADYHSCDCLPMSGNVFREWITPSVIDLATVIKQGNIDGYEPLWDALYDAGCDNEEIERHCKGMRRCPKCLGTKIRHFPNEVDILTRACLHCGMEGWSPMKFPHTTGCWLIELLLEIAA